MMLSASARSTSPRPARRPSSARRRGSARRSSSARPPTSGSRRSTTPSAGPRSRSIAMVMSTREARTSATERLGPAPRPGAGLTQPGEGGPVRRDEQAAAVSQLDEGHPRGRRLARHARPVHAPHHPDCGGPRLATAASRLVGFAKAWALGPDRQLPSTPVVGRPEARAARPLNLPTAVDR